MTPKIICRKDTFWESVSRWETPATHYPLSRIGCAEIAHYSPSVGVYPYEFIQRPSGRRFYRFARKETVTNLLIDGKVWMVDDPLHWFGMREYIRHTQPDKPLLLVGLGLGLAVHLAVQTQASKIIVCEIEKDVIKLVEPHLPNDSRIVIRQGDFYKLAPKLGEIVQDGTVLFDLLVGNITETPYQYIQGKTWLWLYFARAVKMIFGTMDEQSGLCF